MLNGSEEHEHENRRHTPEQVVWKLREADRLLGEGVDLPEVVKGVGGVGGGVSPGG